MDTKKKIRIAPIKKYKTTVQDIYDLLLLDYEKYDVAIDYKAPDYLLVYISDVLRSKDIYDILCRLYTEDRVCIFYADEAISPDLNIYDYAIVYDDNFCCSDRIVKRPNSRIYRGARRIGGGTTVHTMKLLPILVGEVFAILFIRIQRPIQEEMNYFFYYQNIKRWTHMAGTYIMS